MNYFAHLHLAHISQTSLTGNLLGDFIKGSKLSHLPKELELGIRLHRKIDSFTDAHPICQEFKREHSEIRRYAGVGLDILFDHILAKQLDGQYSKLSEQFYGILQKECSIHQDYLPEEYQNKLEAITNQDWFATYRNFDGITLALERTALRFKRPVKLTSIATWYDAQSADIDKLFSQLYQDTCEFTLETKLQLNDVID